MGTMLMHFCVELGAIGVVMLSLWIALRDNRSTQ